MSTGTPTDPRAYEVYVRGPSSTLSFCFGTTDAVRTPFLHSTPVVHQGLISVVVTPVDNPPSDFGIITSGDFTVEIADEPFDANNPGVDGLGADWLILLEDGSYLFLEDGSGRLIMDY